MNWIKLYHVPFTKSYDDVINFSNESERSDFFRYREQADFAEDDISVVKELTNIRIYANYNIIYASNYAIFENEIDGKIRTWYAFIDRVTWEGVGVVGLSLTLDLFQSYLFNTKIDSAFVERGHTKLLNSDGSINLEYLRTPETVSTGEQVDWGEPVNIQFPRETAIAPNPGLPLLFIIAIGGKTLGSSEVTPTFNRVPYPILVQCTFVMRDYANTNLEVSIGGQGYKLMTLQSFLNEAKAKAFESIYISGNFPGDLTQADSNGRIKITGFQPYKYANGSTYFLVPNGIITNGNIGNVEFTFDKTEPKLSCYPYSYKVVADSRQADWELKPQNVIATDTSGKAQIPIHFVQTPSADYEEGFYPESSNYLGGGIHEMHTLQVIPEAAQAGDKYLEYMFLHKTSFWSGLANNTIRDISGASAKAGKLGAVTGTISALTQISDAFASLGDLENQPPEARQQGQSLYSNLAVKSLGLCEYSISIPQEAKDRVRQYFQMFGYTVRKRIDNMNTFINSRKAWNYVKVLDINITGMIQNDHVERLRAIYKHGIRIWHYNSQLVGETNAGMYDYSRDNSDK